ncbi:hypothetical protein D769_08537 [Cupriavidus sp. HMR-1]|nr:hypothetical protein D769_08537 [Cupriavidus sp. HMR-1]
MNWRKDARIDGMKRPPSEHWAGKGSCGANWGNWRNRVLNISDRKFLADFNEIAFSSIARERHAPGLTKHHSIFNPTAFVTD